MMHVDMLHLRPMVANGLSILEVMISMIMR